MKEKEKNFDNKFDIVCKKCGAHNCEFDVDAETSHYSMSYNNFEIIIKCPICGNKIIFEY